MKYSIFNTPLLTPVLSVFARLCLKISGWKLTFKGAESLPKSFVLIGAPHTSNWDFILMILTALTLQIKIKWMGKHSLFKSPFKLLMLWMGGIPVDRRKAHNLVTSVATEFKNNSDLIVLIPPEGTRSPVSEWKTGFYHIARISEVPVLMAAIDSKAKELKLLGSVRATQSDEEAIAQDIALIKEYYKGIDGINPKNSAQK